MDPSLDALLDAQRTDPKVRVRRTALAYQRVLRKQVQLSDIRRKGAARGKSLNSLITEYQRGEYGARKGAYRGPPRELPPGSELEPFTPPALSAGDAPADSRDTFVCRMARMQVQASELSRGEIRRQCRSTADLRVPGKLVHDRLELEKMGMEEVLQDAMRRAEHLQAAAGVTEQRSAEQDSGDEAQHDEESVAQQDARDIVYVDQVEKWHRSLLWGQQFEFFDAYCRGLVADEGQVQEEEAQKLARERRKKVEKPQLRQKRFRPELPQVPGMPVATWTTTFRPSSTSSSAFRSTVQSLKSASAPSLFATGSSAMSQTLPACWRITESQSRLRPRPVSTAPSLLDDWGSHYYGGKGPTVAEHEDVLHTVNPRVFPLQELPLREPTPTTPQFYLD